jgi:hypothetical protein
VRDLKSFLDETKAPLVGVYDDERPVVKKELL